MQNKSNSKSYLTSFVPCKVFAPNLLCFFVISSLLLSFYCSSYGYPEKEWQLLHSILERLIQKAIYCKSYQIIFPRRLSEKKSFVKKP